MTGKICPVVNVLKAKEFSPVYFAEFFIILSSKQQLDNTRLAEIKDMVLQKIEERCMYKVYQEGDPAIMKIPIPEEEISTIKEQITDILNFDYTKLILENEEKIPM